MEAGPAGWHPAPWHRWAPGKVRQGCWLWGPLPVSVSLSIKWVVGGDRQDRAVTGTLPGGSLGRGDQGGLLRGGDAQAGVQIRGGANQAIQGTGPTQTSGQAVGGTNEPEWRGRETFSAAWLWLRRGAFPTLCKGS